MSDDLTILYCSCGWSSEELTREQRNALGIPWYCGSCNKQNINYVRFDAHEREKAHEIVKVATTKATVVPKVPTPQSEPFIGKTYIADGWQYRDLPRMTPDAMELLLSIIGGESEVRWMTKAKYEDGSVRGQLLISPQGMANLKAYTEKGRQ